MCDKPGLISSMMISAESDRALARHEQKIREDAIRSVTGQQPKRETLTEKAQTMLIVVAGIVLLGSAQLVLHIVAVTLAVLAGLLIGAVAAVAVVAIRRRRRSRAAIAVPLPAAAIRAVVTDAKRRAIGPRQPVPGTAAAVRSRAANRR